MNLSHNFIDAFLKGAAYALVCGLLLALYALLLWLYEGDTRQLLLAGILALGGLVGAWYLRNVYEGEDG